MTPRPLAKRVRRPVIVGPEGIALVDLIVPILARKDARTQPKSA